MSRTDYNIYLEQTFVLSKTMIIKHEEIAQSINEELFYHGFWDNLQTNPYNWRYYLNLNGQYHPFDTALLVKNYGTGFMMVRQATDNGYQEVAFTKELLHGTNADLSLANEYSIGSPAYNKLVDKYPEFEQLIIGILNPIDLDTAIKAKNGEILFIDNKVKVYKDGIGSWVSVPNRVQNKLVQEQEHNLVEELQRWIYNYYRNWVNLEYMQGNDLYVVCHLGVLYSQLPNVIMNIRLGNCKTPYAHTFHITQYLESYGQLGRFVKFIPIQTSLWLYRNAIYLEANRGKQLTFNSLLDNTLTPNNVPMNAYTARHEISQMNRNNLLPEPVLYKEVLNFEVDGASDDDRTIRDILNDQIPLARDNKKHLTDWEKKIEEAIVWGGDDRVLTKVLESEMLYTGEPYPFTLESMLLNTWGYSAVKGKYKGTVYVTHPLTGDRIGLSGLNAYILAIYCLNISVADKKLTNIPSVRFYNLQKNNNETDYPTDTTFTGKPDIDRAYNWVDHEHTRRLKVIEVLGTHEPKFLSNSPEMFHSNVLEMYHERIRKYNVYCNTEDLIERGDLEFVAKKLYWFGCEESLGTGSYLEWQKKVGIDLDGLTKEEFFKLGMDLVVSATGNNHGGDLTKRWLQKSLLSILKHFISYTVHILEKYVDGLVSYLEGQTLRFSNFEWQYLGMETKYYPLNTTIRFNAKYIHPVHYQTTDVLENINISIKPYTKVMYEVNEFNLNVGIPVQPVGRYPLGLTILNLQMDIKEAPPPPKSSGDVVNSKEAVTIDSANKKQLVKVSNLGIKDTLTSVLKFNGLVTKSRKHNKDLTDRIFIHLNNVGVETNRKGTTYDGQPINVNEKVSLSVTNFKITNVVHTSKHGESFSDYGSGSIENFKMEVK